MEDMKRKMVDELRNQIDELAENEKKAVLWIIRNYRELEAICSCDLFTPQKREALIEKAGQEDNALLLAFVLWEQRRSKRTLS